MQFIEAPSNQTSGIKEKSTTINTLIPLTILQIKKIQMNGDQFFFHNQPIQYINTVARIDLQLEQDVRITFKLNDDTGILQAEVFKITNQYPDFMKYLNEENMSSMYYQFILVVRLHKNEPLFMCHHLNPIQDHNQITRHYSNLMIEHFQLYKKQQQEIEKEPKNSNDYYEKIYEQYLKQSQSKKQVIKLVNNQNSNVKKQLEMNRYETILKQSISKNDQTELMEF